MSIDSYCSLDLDRHGPLVQDLLSGAKAEIAQDEIILSDHVGERPSNLTPEMALWYDSNIRTARSAALDEVEQHLTTLQSKTHGSGVFLEREVWKARQKELSDKREALRAEREARQKDYSDLKHHQDEIDKLSARYEQKRNRYNREPMLTKMGYYVPALIVLGTTDMALNWEHIFDAKIGSPIISTGLSFGIAVGLAYSGHLTGMTLRQFKARFSRANDDLDIWAGWKMFSLASTLLSVALAAVYWIRIEYFGVVRAETVLLGGELPSLYGTVIGSMLTNIIVWIVGTTIAFLSHDPDPGFPEAKIALDRESAAHNRLQRTLNKHLNRRFERAAAQATDAIESAKNRDASLAQVAAQQESRRKIERVKAQDAQVLAAFSRYRSSLVQAKPTDSHSFVKLPLLDNELRERLTPAQYNAVGLELTYA